jgi:putative endopeptidase
MNAQAFETDRKRAQLAGPVDRHEWYMTAPTVDAYYSPNTNEIAFPAGVLQQPLFDPAADDAFNYGSTGATIGHELGHGFDSRGSHYDSDGNLRDWWSPQDHARYQAMCDALIAQFEAFEPLPGVHVNGQLTLSENMGDLAGLEIALKAYRASLHGRLPSVIVGLTGEQRFFLGYAQSFLGKSRDELLRAQLKSNPHAPERYRVNGAVANMTAFYKAYGVKPGDKLYLDPAKRVTLW